MRSSGEKKKGWERDKGEEENRRGEKKSLYSWVFLQPPWPKLEDYFHMWSFCIPEYDHNNLMESDPWIWKKHCYVNVLSSMNNSRVYIS